MEISGFEDLLARARAGDLIARTDLASLTSAEAHAHAHRQLSGARRLLAGDVSASRDVVLAALDQIDEFGGSTRPGLVNWLASRIVRHVRKTTPTPEPLPPPGRVLAVDSVLADPGAATDTGEGGATARARVEHAVGHLEGTDRRLLELYLRGVPWFEIAAALDLESPAQARKRCEQILDDLSGQRGENNGDAA